MAIEEKEEQTTSLKDLIELVEKDPLPSNVFTIEDKDPMVILGKLNEVIAYLKNLQATINASDSKANQALDNALLALTTAHESITASTTALNSSNKALETANLAIDTANTSLTNSSDAKTSSSEALRLSTLSNEKADTANVLSANALDTAGEANTKAENAIESADSALTTANEAKTKADNASTLSNEAKTKADNASTLSNEAKTKADNASTLSNEAKTKADNASTLSNEAKTKADNASTISNEANTKATNALQVAQEALNQVTESLGSKVYDNNGNLMTNVKFAGHNGVNVDLGEDNETIEVRVDETLTKAIEDNHTAIEQTKAQAQANASDIDTLTDMVTGRANIDLSNVSYPAITLGSTTTGSCDRVIETYISSNGNTWYRKWASGWKECGISGAKGTSSFGFYTIALPLSFSSTNYTANATYITQSTGSINQVTQIGINTKYTDSIRIAVNGADITKDIYCCGY